MLTAVAPQWALRRVAARLSVERLYAAASPSGQHRTILGGRQSGDAVMEHTKDKIRVWARHLDENHDLVTGLFSALAIRSSRLQPEPMVKLRGGALAEVFNERLLALWERWKLHCDWSGTLAWNDLSRVTARTWLRDGEVFQNHMLGAVNPSGIPYQIEALEPDYVPFDLTVRNPLIVHGVRKDPSSGRPLGYQFLKSHPGNFLVGDIPQLSDTNFLDVGQVSHLKHVQRLHQTRGVSILHPCVHRLDDIQDYEQSEQIAARVSAALCAAITKQPGMGPPSVDGRTGERPFELQAGQVFDLNPGESVETIGAARPSDRMTDFRALLLRSVCAGTGTRYSLVSRDYTQGSYSQQRQELVEGVMFEEDYQLSYQQQSFIHVWRNFVSAVLVANQAAPVGVNLDTLMDVECTSVTIPWIDIEKEVKADKLAVDSGFDSRPNVIRRRRGAVPARVDAERLRDAAVQNEIEKIQAEVPPAPTFTQTTTSPSPNA